MFSQLCLKIKYMCLISSSSLLPAAIREQWGSADREMLQRAWNSARKLGKGWWQHRNPSDQLSCVSSMNDIVTCLNLVVKRAWSNEPGLLIIIKDSLTFQLIRYKLQVMTDFLFSPILLFLFCFGTIPSSAQVWLLALIPGSVLKVDSWKCQRNHM